MTTTERIAEIRARFELFKTKQMWLTNSTMAQDLQFLLDEVERLQNGINQATHSEAKSELIYTSMIERREKALEKCKHTRDMWILNNTDSENWAKQEIARKNVELEKILSGREG